MEPQIGEEEYIDEAEYIDDNDDDELDEIESIDRDRIDTVFMGKTPIQTQYFSNYPAKMQSLLAIHTCRTCFYYTNDCETLHEHETACVYSSPPGNAVFSAPGGVKLWEVGGKGNKVYCQSLALLMKCFIGCKQSVTQTEFMNFYVLTRTARRGDEFIEEPIAAFSKMKSRHFNSQDFADQNLSCICVFPQHTGGGYGELLVALSYTLTKREGKKVGRPEEPFSSGGHRLYTSYWAKSIAEKFGLDLSKPRSLTAKQTSDIIAETCFHPVNLTHLCKSGVAARPLPRPEMANVERVPSALPRFSSIAELEAFVDAHMMSWTGEAMDTEEDAVLSLHLYRTTCTATLEVRKNCYDEDRCMYGGVRAFEVSAKTLALSGEMLQRYMLAYGTQLPPGIPADGPALTLYEPHENSPASAVSIGVPHDTLRSAGEQEIAIGTRKRKATRKLDLAIEHALPQRVNESMRQIQRSEAVAAARLHREDMAALDAVAGFYNTSKPTKRSPVTDFTMKTKAAAAGGKAPRKLIGSGGKAPSRVMDRLEQDSASVVYDPRIVASNKAAIGGKAPRILFETRALASKALGGKAPRSLLFNKARRDAKVAVMAEFNASAAELSAAVAAQAKAAVIPRRKATLHIRMPRNLPVPVGVFNPGMRCYAIAIF
jgi:hypothetical protein